MMQDLRAFSLVHNDFTLTIAMWYAFDLFNSYETRLDRVLIIKLERRHEEQRPERLYKCLEIRLETMAEYESRMGSITAMVKRADDRHRGLGNSGAATVALSEDRLVGDTTLVSRRQCRFTHSLITVWKQTGPTSTVSLPIFDQEKPIWGSLKVRQMPFYKYLCVLTMVCELQARPNFDWKAYIKQRIDTGDVRWTGPIPS